MVEAASGSKAARLIARGAGYSVAGLLVRAGARLLFLAVAGQLYGALVFGAFSLAVAAVELAVAVAGLGMKRILFQQLDNRGERAAEHVLADAALLVIFAAAVLAGLFIAAAWLVPADLLSERMRYAVILIAPMIGGQALLDLMVAATRWHQQFRFEVLARSIVEPYVLVAAAATAFYAGLDESGLLIAYSAGTLAALGYALSGVLGSYDMAALRSYRASAQRLWDALRFAAANTLVDALSALYLRLDLFLVGIVVGEHAAGLYGMARQLAAPVRQLRQSFDSMLVPLVSRTLHAAGTAQAGRAIASAARQVLVLQLPIVIALVAAGRPLLAWFGPEFAAAWLAAVLLVLAETVQGAFGIADLLFVYLKPRLGLFIIAGTLLFGLAAGLAMTLLSGIDGAAAAVLLTYAARAWVRRFGLRASLGVTVPLRHHAGPLAAGLAGIIAASLTAAWPIALAAGLAAYLAVLLVWLRASGETLRISQFTAE